MKSVIRNQVIAYKNFISQQLICVCENNCLCTSSSKAVVVKLSLEFQLRMLLHSHFDAIHAYHTFLQHTDNGDLLYNSPSLASTDPLFLHMLVSTDGGNPFTKSNKSIWPLSAILLNLPCALRTQNINIIILALWMHSKKPKWDLFLSDYLKSFPFGHNISLQVGMKSVNVVVIIHSCVFDLPAQASILNCTQYNGNFGCLFCDSVGTQIKRKKGTARIYPFTAFTITSCANFTEYSFFSG